MQAWIDNLHRNYEESLRGIVSGALLPIFEADLTMLCGDSYRPSASPFRPACSERVTIRISQGKECVAKGLVGKTLPRGTERNERLKSYEEVGSRSGTVCRVRCWNPRTDQLSRWISAALLRAQEVFRWMHWHKDMGALAAALGRCGYAAPSLSRLAYRHRRLRAPARESVLSLHAGADFTAKDASIRPLMF